MWGHTAYNGADDASDSATAGLMSAASPDAAFSEMGVTRWNMAKAR